MQVVWIPQTACGVFMHFDMQAFAVTISAHIFYIIKVCNRKTYIIISSQLANYNCIWYKFYI